MGKTFDPALPEDRDWVRLLIGDTVVATAELEDETIDAMIAEEESINGAGLWIKYLVAARAGEAAASRWVATSKGVIEKVVDGLRIRRAEGESAATVYADHLCKLRERGAELLLRKTGRPSPFGML